MAAGKVNATASIVISHVHGHGPSLSSDAFVILTLTSYIPRSNFQPEQWTHLNNIQLTEDRPHDPTPIQVIIGADLYDPSRQSSQREA